MHARTDRGCTAMVIAALAVLAAATVASAQEFSTLLNFDKTNGQEPLAGLVQATDGNLYGTTTHGRTNTGTVFKVSTSGTLTTLYNFCSQPNCADGYYPEGLIQATDGNFYGTTLYGGLTAAQCISGCGTVFKSTPAGTLTILHQFCTEEGCADGEYPNDLIQGADGNLYGTTEDGGAYGYYGTVFKITTSGTLTTLYSFCAQTYCADGANPDAGLVQGTDGNFYGTTGSGGTVTGGPTGGTVFKITPTGTLNTLYRFFCMGRSCLDGSSPMAALIQAIDGNFYGTTYGGGATGNGTVFKITPSGKLTTLYSFCAQANCTDGDLPSSPLFPGTDGNFYGTTLDFGADGGGTLFRITPSGKLTTLVNFDSTYGYESYGGVIQDTNGAFYGTTFWGGTSIKYGTCSNEGCGTIFSLSTGLGPFVETLPSSGKVGTPVKILGTDLTGATSVAFNGSAAKFKVVSPSEITTAVPSGATTGTVQVALPGQTLSSRVPFRVIE